MRKSKIKHTLFTVAILIFFSQCSSVLAADNQSFNLNKQPVGYGIPAFGSSGEGLIALITKNVIFLFFTIGGVGTVIYFLWGAVDWILSGGDKEKVSNARKKMTHALIGLTLLALSFVIIRTVGRITGFDPLGSLQIRYLGNDAEFVPNR